MEQSGDVKASERTLRNALHSRNIYCRRLRTKPVLTDDDIKQRYSFAKKYSHMTKTSWRKKLHVIIDCKHFPVYVNGKGRAWAAQRDVRGAYRKPRQGLSRRYTAVPKDQRYCPGG